MKCWKGLGDFVPFLVRHMSRSGNRDQIAAALGKVRDLQGEAGLNEPFTAFHNGSETEVSLDEVKLVRFGVIDNICERSYSCAIPVKCVYEGIEFHLGNSG